MPSALSPLVAALAQERAAFLDGLTALTPAQRSTAPAPGAWSPLEVAEHAYRTERAMLRGVEKQLAAGDARTDVGPRLDRRVDALLEALRSPKRFAVPEGARVHPAGMAYDKLHAAWSALGSCWDDVARTLPPALLATPLIRHPLGGPMTTEDALRFLILHTARHLGQFRRAAAALAAA